MLHEERHGTCMLHGHGHGGVGGASCQKKAMLAFRAGVKGKRTVNVNMRPPPISM
jgi:hypothetical protein